MTDTRIAPFRALARSRRRRQPLAAVSCASFSSARPPSAGSTLARFRGSVAVGPIQYSRKGICIPRLPACTCGNLGGALIRSPISFGEPRRVIQNCLQVVIEAPCQARQNIANHVADLSKSASSVARCHGPEARRGTAAWRAAWRETRRAKVLPR